jgi:hypothetical protein
MDKQRYKDLLFTVHETLEEIERSKILSKCNMESDFAVAAMLMKTELEEYENSCTLALAVDSAPNPPENLLAEMKRLDDLERNDREVALRLAPKREKAIAERSEATYSTMNRELTAIWKSFEDLHLREKSGSTSGTSHQERNDSTSWAHTTHHEKVGSTSGVQNATHHENVGSTSGTHASKKEKPTTECISCFNPCDQKAVCGHFYCKVCIRELCLNATKDINFFPARCCKKEIVQEYIERALSPEELANYKALQLNLSSASIKNLDPEYRLMVSQFGWKICPSCGAGIEKTQDCNHMTCAVCKTQFCYLCNATWVPRTCKCELWAEDELERILDERAPLANMHERARLRRVYQEHDQHVHEWERQDIIRKYKKCATCGWVCNLWYWRCEDCSTNSCGNCAHNRG